MKWLVLLLLPLVAVGVGCTNNKPEGGPSAAGSKYLLPTEPAEPLGVRDARQQTKDGDDVAIVGRIGGRKDVWGSGQASFSLIDTSFIPCSEMEGDNCETPWDYCCDDKKKLLAGMAEIKMVDGQGATVPQPAKELLGVKELQTVVVRGKAKRDDKGNLTVLATGLYVRPDPKK